MKKIRFWLVLLLCLCICLPASAAKRKDAGIADPVTPISYTAQNNAEKIPNMLDDETPTSYYYTVWNSERTDDIPEVTFNFGGVTLGSIWVRNGDCESEQHYWEDARPHIVTVRVYTGDIGYTDIMYEMDDIYDPVTVDDYWHEGYQRMALPAIFENTTRVDLFIQQWKNGSENTYNINITDIVFSQSGAESTAVAKPAVTFAVQAVQPKVYTGKLLDKLSGRTGPSTTYEELGTFLDAGRSVDVISKGYDTRNSIWWVQCEFSVDGILRRAYTGLKRVDIDINTVPEDTVLCSASVKSEAVCYWGPGEAYARHSRTVAVGTQGTVYAVENGYAQFEYATGKGVRMDRVWLPVDALNMDAEP